MYSQVGGCGLTPYKKFDIRNGPVPARARELQTLQKLEREVHGVLRARLIERVTLLALLPGTLGGDPPAPVRGAALATARRICKLQFGRSRIAGDLVTFLAVEEGTLHRLYPTEGGQIGAGERRQ